MPITGFWMGVEAGSSRMMKGFALFDLKFSKGFTFLSCFQKN